MTDTKKISNIIHTLFLAMVTFCLLSLTSEKTYAAINFSEQKGVYITSATVAEKPTKREYKAGEVFTVDGMKVKAVLSDGSEVILDNEKDLTYKVAGRTMIPGKSAVYTNEDDWVRIKVNCSYTYESIYMNFSISDDLSFDRAYLDYSYDNFSAVYYYGEKFDIGYVPVMYTKDDGNTREVIMVDVSDFDFTTSDGVKLKVGDEITYDVIPEKSYFKSFNEINSTVIKFNFAGYDVGITICAAEKKSDRGKSFKTVTFDPNGGTGEKITIKMDATKSNQYRGYRGTKMPYLGYTREGYVFCGYSLSKNPKSPAEVYHPDYHTIYDMELSSKTKSITLYAVWKKPETCKITYEYKTSYMAKFFDKKASTYYDTYTVGEDFRLLPEVIVKNEKTQHFIGWSFTKDTNSYSDWLETVFQTEKGHVIIGTVPFMFGDVTLYAVYANGVWDY